MVLDIDVLFLIVVQYHGARYRCFIPDSCSFMVLDIYVLFQIVVQCHGPICRCFVPDSCTVSWC